MSEPDKPLRQQILLDAAGFAVIAHIVKAPACGHRTIWLARQHV